jgi:CBS domain-containing protein
MAQSSAIKVGNLLSLAQERLFTISSDSLLVDAAKMFGNRQIGLIVVCDGAGKMAGVISKTDIVGRISHCTGSSCTMAVASAMTRDVTFCGPSDWLHDVWSIIKQHGLKNIPIVNQDHRPVGLLSARDALQLLLEDVEYEEQLLRDYVSCVGYR